MLSADVFRDRRLLFSPRTGCSRHLTGLFIPHRNHSQPLGCDTLKTVQTRGLCIFCLVTGLSRMKQASHFLYRSILIIQFIIHYHRLNTWSQNKYSFSQLERFVLIRFCSTSYFCRKLNESTQNPLVPCLSNKQVRFYAAKEFKVSVVPAAEVCCQNPDKRQFLKSLDGPSCIFPQTVKVFQATYSCHNEDKRF